MDQAVTGNKLAKNVLGPVECERYARSITDQYGLRVEVSDKVECPQTSKGVMKLPKLADGMTDRDIIKFKQGLLHECLHHSEGHEFLAWSEKQIEDGKSFHPNFHMTLNIAEDHRIERLGANKFIGDALLFDEGTKIVLEDLVDRLKEGNKTNPDLFKTNEDFQKTMALMAVDAIARSNWQPSASILIDGLKEELNEPIGKHIEKLVKHGAHEKLASTETWQEMVEVSKELFSLLWEEQDPMPPQKGGGKGKGKGEGDEAGMSEAQSEGSKEAAKMGGRSKHGFSMDHKGEVDYKGSVEGDGKAGGGGAEHINYDLSRYYGAFVPGSTKVIDYALTPPTDEDPHHSMDRGTVAACNPASSSLANRLRLLLQVRSAARYEGGYKTGNIHKKNLYRVGLPMVGNGDYNSKVFKRKVQDLTLDTAVTFLADFSGSMSGYKVATAVNCGRILAKNLSDVLRIPIEVLGFSEVTHDQGYGTVVGVLKGFNEPSLRDDAIVRRSKDFAKYMSQNADGVAVQVAYDRLLKRKEKRKILIVGSDGSPASSMPGDCAAFLKDTVSKIEQDGRAEIYGIGIQDRNVELFYKHNRVIEDSSKLEGALIDVIRDFILNSKGR